MSRPRSVEIALPPWIDDVVDWERAYATDEDKIGLAVDLARENVLRESGGPFGAAVFEAVSGRLVAVGTNSVTRLHSSTLHAEIVALLLAQRRLGSRTLRVEGGPGHEIAASCDPCAMCLGAVLWSGARRLVAAARGEDAERIGFDEGPVFEASFRHLEARGIEVARGVLREKGREVLELYRERGGAIYNG